MAICFPMIHGHLRCTQGRPYSQLSPLCSSFTGSQSPVCWIRQQSSKICIGHCAFEISGLTFRFTFVMASRIHHAHPTFLTFTLQCHPRRQHPTVPFPTWAGDVLCHKRAVWPSTSHLTLWGLGFLISAARGLAIDYLRFPLELVVLWVIPLAFPEIDTWCREHLRQSWQHFFHLSNVCWVPVLDPTIPAPEAYHLVKNSHLATSV